jgi:hypothetical protein
MRFFQHALRKIDQVKAKEPNSIPDESQKAKTHLTETSMLEGKTLYDGSREFSLIPVNGLIYAVSKAVVLC